jgi:hypothetical protein
VVLGFLAIGDQLVSLDLRVLLLLAELTANIDSRCSSSALPHDGHGGTTAFRTSASNSCAQRRHRYS